MCNDWLSKMDEGKINCIVSLDIRKAFDSINNEILAVCGKCTDIFSTVCQTL
jgi:hypothetical protein